LTQIYVIKFVSYLNQVRFSSGNCGFLNQKTCYWNIVENGSNQTIIQSLK
jgi:hypothetical protein